MGLTASYITLGCKLNYSETSTYERGLVKKGFESVPWTEKADLYIINTCSVTEHSDRKSRNIIRKIHRTAPNAHIVVTGCYAELKRDEIETIEGVSLVIGANEKASLVGRAASLFDIAANKPEIGVASKGDDNNVPSHEAASGTIVGGRTERQDREAVADKTEGTFAAYSDGGERTRAFLKVQDGCDNFCSYCTVPFARGRSRSISIDTAVSEARKIASTGVKEIVLTGVNTGDFGRKSGESFFDLMKALDKIPGIERYRISSIEPYLLTDEMIDLISSGTKFLPHFHIPLQSGCDTLLHDTGRRYDTEFFAAKIDYIRKRMNSSPSDVNPDGTRKPDVFLGIDVIVGLPGESEEMFMQTYDFLKERIKPAFIHIFPYSRRSGTRAAARKDQVAESIKSERVARLEELCQRLHEEFITSQKGVRENVLFESKCSDGMIGGYAGNYIRVERTWEDGLAGTIQEVIL